MFGPERRSPRYHETCLAVESVFNTESSAAVSKQRCVLLRAHRQKSQRSGSSPGARGGTAGAAARYESAQNAIQTNVWCWRNNPFTRPSVKRPGNKEPEECLSAVMSALPPTSVHSATPPAMLCVSALLSCGRLQTQMR